MTTEKNGMVSRTCRNCGRTVTLPENVQCWPTYCQECRVKLRPEETVTRTCRRCGRTFTFSSALWQWPKLCPACRES